VPASTIATPLAVVGALVVCCPLVGRYLATVYGGAGAPGDRFAAPLERPEDADPSEVPRPDLTSSEQTWDQLGSPVAEAT